MTAPAKEASSSSSNSKSDSNPLKRISQCEIPNQASLDPSNILVTSEAVSDGDLDKVCDLIADAAIDAVLQQDKFAKMTVRVLIKSRMVMLVGDLHSKACVEYDELVRGLLKNCGYDDEERVGIDYRNCNVVVAITEHSPDIGQYIAMYGGGGSGAVARDSNASVSPKNAAGRDSAASPTAEGNGNDASPSKAAAAAVKYPTQNDICDSCVASGYATSELLDSFAGSNEANRKKVESNKFYSRVVENELMPVSQSIAVRLARQLSACRRERTIAWLRPESKVQVTLEHSAKSKGFKPLRIHRVAVTAACHDAGVSLDKMRKELKALVVDPVLNGVDDNTSFFAHLVDENTAFHLNHISGQVVLGARAFFGALANEGMSGQKTHIDFYGGHGAANFSSALIGRDPFKLERSANLAARWICKSLVKAGLCGRCELELSYSGAFDKPIALRLETFGTVKKGKSDADILEIVENNFDLRIGALHRTLEVAKPGYANLAVFGFCGSEGLNFETPKWEQPLQIEA